MNGITRIKRKNGFIYRYNKTNKSITKSDLDRIKKLAIPPIWDDVCISDKPRSKIQAYGYDNKDRKQYIYNQIYINQQTRKKFHRLYEFIHNMPLLLKHMKKHSKLHKYDKKRIISTILYIINKLYMRVGNEKYAEENKSYGITSLQKRHIDIVNNTIHFNFMGKSKQQLSYKYTDKKIASHIKDLLKLKGRNLFKYKDENGVRKISSSDLNDYIKKYMGEQFTCKDFRTYASNHHFVKYLIKNTDKNDIDDDKQMKQNLLTAIKDSASYMKHTKNVAKSSYIMDYFIESYKKNPLYFTKEDCTNCILLNLLKKYKKS